MKATRYIAAFFVFLLLLAALSAVFGPKAKADAPGEYPAYYNGFPDPGEIRCPNGMSSMWWNHGRCYVLEGERWQPSTWTWHVYQYRQDANGNWRWVWLASDDVEWNEEEGEYAWWVPNDDTPPGGTELGWTPIGYDPTQPPPAGCYHIWSCQNTQPNTDIIDPGNW